MLKTRGLTAEDVGSAGRGGIGGADVVFYGDYVAINGGERIACRYDENGSSVLSDFISLYGGRTGGVPLVGQCCGSEDVGFGPEGSEGVEGGIVGADCTETTLEATSYRHEEEGEGFSYVCIKDRVDWWEWGGGSPSDGRDCDREN